jgi:hypothetical protein
MSSRSLNVGTIIARSRRVAGTNPRYGFNQILAK